MQQHLSLRIPFELMERVEQYRVQMQEQFRQNVTQATALRSLIAAGLEAEGYKETKPKE